MLNNSYSNNPPIDLELPIFTYYLNTNGKSPQSLHLIADEVRRFFPSNITVWIVPSEDPTKIECVWKGKSLESERGQLKDKLEKIVNWLETLPESESRQLIRNFIIDELV